MIIDWVSACRGLVVEGARGRGRSRKTYSCIVRVKDRHEAAWIAF